MQPFIKPKVTFTQGHVRWWVMSSFVILQFQLFRVALSGAYAAMFYIYFVNIHKVSKSRVLWCTCCSYDPELFVSLHVQRWIVLRLY